MTEHHLPDDPRNWPTDPFQLLGIELPASESDLKRAYTRLIRRFKPEHHPEEFRRIREAYETAQERAKWFGFFSISPPVTPPPDDSATSTGSELLTPPTPQSPSEEDLPAERTREAPRSFLVDPVAEAWKMAVTNQRPQAYARLNELQRERPDGWDIPLRLYWLLAVQPDLDPARTQHDWLLEALTRSRLSGPSVELYSRELEINPQTALFEPYCHLLQVDAPGGNLLRVARLRLAKAGLARSWASIDLDLQALAERNAELDEVGWLSYLVGVMANVAFDRPAPVYQRCSNQLAILRHLELRETWAFDQIDEQQHLASLWRSAEAAPTPVRDVVRDAWLTTGQEGWKKSMRRAAAWVVRDPAIALEQFDRAARVPDCQQVLAAFQRLLDDCQPQDTLVYPPGVIRGLVREFLSKNSTTGYLDLRNEFIRLLVQEAIDPHEVVQACLVDSAFRPRYLVEHLSHDSVLRLVWRTAYAVQR
jgi:hypothetical protein